MVITGQNTTEILFIYIFIPTIKRLLVNNVAEEMLV